MRLGIISDTHDDIERTRIAVELLRTEGADALAHCGDITGPQILRACASIPCYFVFGNHDADTVPDLQRAADETGAVCLGWGGTVDLAGKRVGLVHGHLTADLRRVLAEQPDYLLSGHSHFPADRHEGRVRRINPGALHRADSLTVAILDLNLDEVRFLRVAEERPALRPPG